MRKLTILPNRKAETGYIVIDANDGEILGELSIIFFNSSNIKFNESQKIYKYKIGFECSDEVYNYVLNKEQSKKKHQALRKKINKNIKQEKYINI